MGGEGSEERLRITLKVDDGVMETELPLRMLFIGDFLGVDERPVEERVPDARRAGHHRDEHAGGDCARAVLRHPVDAAPNGHRLERLDGPRLERAGRPGHPRLWEMESMGHQGTRAERLRIVCKASPDDPRETELPLRMLFVGDFKGRDERPLHERIPVRVDRDNLDRVLAAHAPQLDITVSTDSPGARAIRAPLVFHRLADFGPDAVAEQIPDVQRLLRLRDALTTLKMTRDVDAFRAALAASVEDAAARDRLLEALGLAAS
jgi:type VI secretion system protein ImpB